MTRRYLDHIFYVYSEANVAVLLALLAAIELGCYLVAPLFWQPFCLGAAALMAFFALLNVLTIVRSERAFERSRREWSEQL